MMSYVILKILSFFLVPSNVLVGIGLVGIILTRTHFARAGKRFLIVSVTLLFIIGVFPVGAVLTLPLEARFPPWQPGQSAPTGIIVLGSAINPEISAARGEVALNDAAERIIAIVKLARRYPNARVVFSGGNGNLFVSAPSEAVLRGAPNRRSWCVARPHHDGRDGHAALPKMRHSLHTLSNQSRASAGC